MSSMGIGVSSRTLFTVLNETSQVLNGTNTTALAVKQVYDLNILVPLLLCCIGVFLLGVPGNMMVIHVLGIKQRSNRNNDGDVFIVSLAVADLLASSTVPLVITHDLLATGRWYLGEFFCHLLPVLNPVTLVTSSWALVAISAERYRIISRPFSGLLPRKAKIIFVASVWVFGIMVNIPLAVQLRYTDHSVCMFELYKPVRQILYASFFIAIGWVMPGVVLSTLYFKTATHLRNNEAYHSNTQVMQRQVRKENKQVARMFVIIVTLFFVFTIPNAIYQIVYSYLYLFDIGVIKRYTYLSKLYLVLPCVSAMNSCVNPLVYAKMHREVNRYIRSNCARIKCFICLQSSQECQDTSRTMSQKNDTQMDTLVTINNHSLRHTVAS